MTMRRLLSWLVSFCFLFSAVGTVAYGAEWTSIDDLGIDPWGDFETIQALPTPSPEVGQDLEQVENLTIYDVGEDTAIAPYALDVSGYVWPRTGNGSTIIRVQGLPAISNISDHQTFDLHTGFNVIGSSNDDGSYFRTNLAVLSGASYQLLAYVNYPASANSKIYLSGQLSVYPMIKYTSNTGSEVRLTVDTSTLRSKLLVNGSPVGSWVSGDRLSFADYEIDLSQTGNIYSIGILVEATDRASSDGATIDRYGNKQPIQFGIYVSDQLSISADTKYPGQDNDEETKGILQTILSGVTDIFTAIINLPAQIVAGLKTLLQELFIPSQSDIQDIQAKYSALLEERLGFVWQVGDWVVTFAQSCLTAMKTGSGYVFRFPGISVDLPEGTFVIVPEQAVDINNPAMDVIRPVVGTVVSLVSVLAFVNTAEHMLISVVSGASYFDFIRGRKDDS